MATTLWMFNFGNLFTLIFILWIAIRSPYLSRKDLFFAVTVHPEFPGSPEGQAIYHRYRRTLLLFGGVAVVMIALGNWKFLNSKDPDAAFVVTLVIPGILALGLQLAGLLAAYREARKEVLPHAAKTSSVREVALTPEPVQKASRALLFFRLGPWVILALAALYLQANWDRIPERFPNHWGAGGVANGWANRSYYGVFGPILMAAATLLLLEVTMFLLTLGMPRGASVKNSRNRDLSWMVQATRWLVASIGYFIAIAVGGMGAWTPFHARSGSMPPFMAIFLVISNFLLLIGLAIFAAWMMNKKDKTRAAEGLAVSGPGSGKASPLGDRTEDRFWKLGGTIYYNPDDPAIWVEKRMGLGWTTNMARPASWFLVGGMFALIGLFMLALIWIGAQGRQ